MATLTIIGIATFTILLMGMSLTAGTQASISQLAYTWRWLLMVALCSQVLLLPQMLDVTPNGWQWLPFFGVAAIIVCGAASVFDKADEWAHIIAASVAFVCMTGWVMLINGRCLLPLIVCIAAGRENWKWRVEIGLIISVYMTLILL